MQFFPDPLRVSFDVFYKRNTMIKLSLEKFVTFIKSHLWDFLSLIFLWSLLIGTGCYIKHKNNESSGWTPTQGIIEDSYLIEGGGKYNIKTAKIKYIYLVGNQLYQSDRICVIGSGNGDVEKLVTKNRPGTHVIVYVNPMNPREAVLLKEEWAIDNALIGLGLLGIILTPFLISYRQSLQDRRAALKKVKRL